MKEYSIIHILLISIVILLSGNTTALAQKEGTTTIRGVLVHSFTRKMIEENIKMEVLDLDSTLVDSCLSTGYKPGWTGNFFLIDVKGLRGTKKEFIVRFSHPDYKTEYRPVSVSFYGRANNVSLGDVVMRRLSMKEKEIALGGIVVKSTKVKFFYKGDTLVYNADAFQLAEGSMLDALISQLPGVELKDDGRIYVNGRFVDNLLLNGKDFFKGKNEVLLENLPAYTVKNLKVYEEESDLSKMLGTKVDEGRYVMDVQIKREYEIGWFANAELGGGTEDRYLGRLFALRFTPNSRLSFFANINNLNDKRKPGKNGEWPPSDLNGGLTATKMGGFDYNISDKWKRYDFEGFVQAKNTGNDYQSRREQQNFLPDGDTYDRSWYNADNKETEILTDNSLKLYLGKEKWYNYILIKPFFRYQRTESDYNRLSGTFSQSPSVYSMLYDSLFTGNTGSMALLNRELRIFSGKGNYMKSQVTINSSIKMPHTEDGLFIVAATSHENSGFESFDRYFLNYAAGNNDFRDQYTDMDRHKYNYNFSAEYYIRTKNWLLRPFYSMSHRYEKKTNTLYGYNMPDSLGMGDDLLPSVTDNLMRILDPRNSYRTEQHITTHYLSFVIMLNYKRWKNRKGNESRLYIRVEPFAHTYEDKRMHFVGLIDNRRCIGRWLPSPRFNSSYNTPGYRHELHLDYSMTVNTPDMFNLIDMMFDSDPLNIHLGNPNLKNTLRHRIDFRYRADKWLQGTGRMLSANAGYSHVDDAVAMGYVYDKTTGIRTYQPDNVDGNWDVWLHVYFTTPVDRKRRVTLSTATEVDHGHNVDLVSLDAAVAPSRSIVRQVWARENLRMDYRFGKNKVGVRGRVGYSNVRNSREGFQSINAANIDYGMNALLNLPWGIEFSTDLTMYSRRGYSNRSMNTDELVWNARLAKSFDKGRFTVALEGFDILGNLSNINYTINGQGRVETWVNSIPQYAMLRAVYKLNKQPKKK